MDYIINDKKLIAEWDFKKNNETGLDPAKTSIQSGKKAWWICQFGHSYYSKIQHRSKGVGCPYCSGRLPIIGVNDLETVNPTLALEWNYNKNGSLKPCDVKSGTNKKVWWVCNNGHEWEANISSRNSGKNCPYCSGRLAIGGKTDLATIRSDLLTVWNYKKNISISPKNISIGSNKKVWWIGKCGHEWEDRVNHIAKLDKINCPYCTGKRVLRGFNDLQSKNPNVALEWDYEKNFPLLPTDITEHSNKKVWWKCKNGHEWQIEVTNRTYGSGCPYCSGRYPIIGKTDLQTVNPKLSIEWDYNKNYPITPQDIAPYTNKKYWWLCDYGHSWQASVNSRSNGSGCPVCSGENKTSFPEQAVLFYLSKYTKALNREQLYDKEIDIWLPEFNVGVEYCGSYWHQDRQRDKNKSNYFNKYGIKIFYIYDYCDDNIINGNIIECKYKNKNIKDLEWAIKTLLNMLSIDELNINIEQDRTLIYEQYILSKKQNSLLIKYPKIAQEWHPTKNGKLTPDMVSYGSHKLIWWKCKRCGCEFQLSPHDKVSKKYGCPECYKRNIGKHFRKIILQYDIDNKLLNIWNSITIAGKVLNINLSDISQCCSGIRKNSGGYQWKYLYDQTAKDGTVIPGAISLGLITEEEALKQLAEQENLEGEE